MKKTKRLALGWKICLWIAAVLALVLLGGRLWFRLPVSDYYRASAPAFAMPGLAESFVPQGLAYVPETDQMLMTGYDNRHGKPSPIYAVERGGSHAVKRVTLRLTDGSECTAHNGGLAVHGGLIYTCDSEVNVLHVFSLAALEAAEHGGVLDEIATVPLTGSGDVVKPSFVTAGAEGLIVGEFYRPKSYETELSHYVGAQHALAVVLPYDDSACGVSPEPSAAYSLPDQAQGMCFDERGQMYISESWGVAFSTIEVFAPSQSTGVITVLGKEIPLTVLGDANRVSAVKIAPMSEEIEIVDGKLYVGCESASMKYIFGILTGADQLLATDLSFFQGK